MGLRILAAKNSDLTAKNSETTKKQARTFVLFAFSAVKWLLPDFLLGMARPAVTPYPCARPAVTPYPYARPAVTPYPYARANVAPCRSWRAG